jgi:hypothetical protein
MDCTEFVRVMRVEWQLLWPKQGEEWILPLTETTFELFQGEIENSFYNQYML